MKRVLISILLATVFASIPVFAESREARPNGFGAEVVLANPAGAPSPQFRRRYRRRRFLIIRRRHYRVRRYRVRQYRRIYVRRGRRRY
ncbi:MAG TPA: hypothetical protein VII34_12305 [Pyrinomonadaceae bacterium]|jgi:hypothetical protein